MKKEIYICDICKKELKHKESEFKIENDRIKDNNEAFGFLNNERIDREIVIYPISKEQFKYCKKHICISCFYVLSEIWNKNQGLKWEL